ncbi:NAD-glutamate dehydrogenase domain-containing protein [Siccirubricoccus sp. G192]|uniref:NAD-glutamate dehydrogenase domain-containing protein n=1 Tax=Siccirubricoccus sp. G192 TaxID=2849651 RepID=UPI0028114A52|nr:NAD-glutamate dehydrogenase domain-containing protein [Siccirubricoccus sp. G192]
MANRLGCAWLARLAMEADPVRVARAAWLAGEAFGLEAACDAIDAAAAPAAARLEALAALRRLQAEAAQGLLASPDLDRPLEEVLAALGPGIAALTGAGAGESPPAAAWVAAGLPAGPAALAAAAPRLAAAPAILQLAAATGAAPEAAAAAWDAVGARFGLEALHAAAHAAPAPGAFGPRAKAALRSDLTQLQGRLAEARLRGHDPAQGPAAEAAARLAREAALAPDLAAVTVASRALAALA